MCHTLVSKEAQGRKGWIKVVLLTGKPHLAIQVHWVCENHEVRDQPFLCSCSLISHLPGTIPAMGDGKMILINLLLIQINAIL